MKCRHCPADAEPGRTQCRHCLDYQKDYQRKRYADLRARGLCPCGQPARPGLRDCAACAGRHHGAGPPKCHTCPEPAAEGHVYCATCLAALRDTHRRRRERRHDAGLCECGKEPAPGLATCQECLDRIRQCKARARARKRRTTATEESP